MIGNLISNTAIVLVALSVSPYAAASALIFLVVIHKLEYFLNAGIIGSRIQARAWELLMAMIVMEAAFGILGPIAAPIFYAVLKIELRRPHLRRPKRADAGDKRTSDPAVAQLDNRPRARDARYS